MARRTINAGTYEEVLQLGTPLWRDIPVRGYVGNRWATETDGPWHALLWSEIRHIEVAGKMTAAQASIFELNIIGVKSVKIAKIFSITEAAVSKHLSIALKKADNVKNKGLLTTVFEECGGWGAVGELLNG
ncbi:MAG: hypothetical protein ABFD54_05790 [Armatimonadota bacterium]|nr:hypothetical protein [bacterium]